MMIPVEKINIGSASQRLPPIVVNSVIGACGSEIQSLPPIVIVVKVI